MPWEYYPESSAARSGACENCSEGSQHAGSPVAKFWLSSPLVPLLASWGLPACADCTEGAEAGPAGGQGQWQPTGGGGLTQGLWSPGTVTQPSSHGPAGQRGLLQAPPARCCRREEGAERAVVCRASWLAGWPLGRPAGPSPWSAGPAGEGRGQEPPRAQRGPRRLPRSGGDEARGPAAPPGPGRCAAPDVVAGEAPAGRAAGGPAWKYPPRQAGSGRRPGGSWLAGAGAGALGSARLGGCGAAAAWRGSPVGLRSPTAPSRPTPICAREGAGAASRPRPARRGKGRAAAAAWAGAIRGRRVFAAGGTRDEPLAGLELGLPGLLRWPRRLSGGCASLAGATRGGAAAAAGVSEPAGALRAGGPRAPVEAGRAGASSGDCEARN